MTRSALVPSAGTAAAVIALLLAAPAQADQGFYLGAMGGVSLLRDATATVTVDPDTATGPISFGKGPAGGVLAGYSFANGLRPELEFTYRRDRIDGDGEVRNAQAIGSLYYSFSRNGYYFYLGGGGGYAKLRASLDNFGKDSDGTPVYSGGTGVGVAVTSQLMAGIDYRYAGAFDSSHFSSSVNGTPASVSFRYRGSFVGLALRYSFGSAMADSFPVYTPYERVRVVPLAE